MFQNNSYSGILFLAGIFYNAPLLCLGALLGTIISTVTAHILKYPKEDIQNGIYGFNGALVGIALWYFFGFTAVTFFAVIIAAAFTSPLNYYVKKIIPPYTAPFVIVTWMVISLLLFVFKVTPIASSVPAEHTFDLMTASANSFGQVMFQENSITGLVFLLAIIINSKISAIYGVYAAVLGTLIGLVFKEPISVINAGLMGYNGILCAIALANHQRSSFVWISGAVFLSVILNLAFAQSGIMALTAPFVLSTWIILKIKASWNKGFIEDLN